MVISILQVRLSHTIYNDTVGPQICDEFSLYNTVCRKEIICKDALNITGYTIQLVSRLGISKSQVYLSSTQSCLDFSISFVM